MLYDMNMPSAFLTAQSYESKSFQARCMASKTPKIATIGCAIAGCLTFVVGIPFAYLGAITRVHYGPDSVHASFETDVSLVLLSAPSLMLAHPDDSDQHICFHSHATSPWGSLRVHYGYQMKGQ